MGHESKIDRDNSQDWWLDISSPVMRRLKKWRLPAIRGRALSWTRPRLWWNSLAELGLIVLWAAWVGRAYLNFDPTVWPVGGDFPLSIHGYYVWSLLPQCGGCVLWNGFMNGGVPAFVDLVGAVLHPIGIASTLIWGVINGAKIIIVASLAMAGFAQWWLAKVMGLGTMPRLWSAGMAVAGGHLAGPMEGGLVGVVLSIAAVSLVIAPGLDLALSGHRRATVWLGVALALALLAGQGYAQLGLLFAVLPAFAVFLFDRQFRVRALWKEFALAGLLAALLAGILWIPVLHFWPHYSKPFDVTFSNSQPLEYAPLNLVISDPTFFRSEALGKKPLPSFYMTYIGWIPVLLGILALRLVPRSRRRVLLFFLIAITLIYVTSSAVILKIMAKYISAFTGIRFPSLTSNLAVTLVLGLAALGLDELLRLEWPEFRLTLTADELLSFNVSWLILIFPLMWGLKSTYDFGRDTLKTYSVNTGYYQIVNAIRPHTGQWVRFPKDDFVFVPVALDAGQRVTDAYRSFTWKDRSFPPASVEVVRDAVDTSAPNFLGTVSGLNLVAHPENEYAVIDTGAKQIPCQAVARGGNIDVDCDADVPGTLTVREYGWSGWKARVDGAPIALDSGQWLSVSAPAGRHHFEFRYRPLDVMVGLSLTMVGVIMTIWFWLHSPPSSLNDDQYDV